MSQLAWLALAMLTVLGTVGQLALKCAVRKERPGITGLRIVLNPYMFTWLVCYAAATVLWLFVLRTVPLSQAFPILGVQFALIPVAAGYFLNERVASVQWIGIVSVAIGVALVGQS